MAILVYELKAKVSFFFISALLNVENVEVVYLNVLNYQSSLKNWDHSVQTALLGIRIAVKKNANGFQIEIIWKEFANFKLAGKLYKPFLKQYVIMCSGTEKHNEKGHIDSNC